MLFFYLGNLNHFIQSPSKKKKKRLFESYFSTLSNWLSFFFFLAELTARFQDPVLTLSHPSLRLIYFVQIWGVTVTVPGKIQLSRLGGPVQGFYINFFSSATNFILILPADPLFILLHQVNEGSTQFTVILFNIFPEKLFHKTSLQCPKYIN